MFHHHKKTSLLPTSGVFSSCLKNTYFFLEVCIYTELVLFFSGKEKKKKTLRKTQVTKQITLITTYREKELALFFLLCIFLDQSIYEK